MPALNYASTLVAGVNENINDVQARLDEIRAIVNALDNDNFDIGGVPLAYEKLALASKIRNADIISTAAIAYSKLAALTSGNILVGSAGNVATSVNPSGVVDLSSAGAFSFSASGESEIEAIMAGGIPANQRDSDATLGDNIPAGSPTTQDVLECNITVPTGGALVQVFAIGFLQRVTAGIDSPILRLQTGDVTINGPTDEDVQHTTLTGDTAFTMVFTSARLGLGSAEEGGGTPSLGTPRALVGNGENEIILGSATDTPALPTAVILNLAAGAHRIELQVQCVAQHTFIGQMFARVVQGMA